MNDLDTEAVVETLPPIAWALAWLFLVGQVVLLFARGVNPAEPVWVVGSMLLSAVVVRWIADGVLRARTGRLAIVWVLLSADVAVGFIGFASDFASDAVEMTGAEVATFAFTLAQLGALGAFCTTDYFKARRVGPGVSRAALAPLLLVAVATGVLGGLTAPADSSSTSMHLKIGL